MGLYYHNSFRYFDAHSNQIFISVNAVNHHWRKGSSTDRGRISDIAIYNIEQDSITYLFKEILDTQRIGHIWFEKVYDHKNKQIVFNHENDQIKNNNKVEPRELSDRILVPIHDLMFTSLWTFDRSGGDKKLIKTIEGNSDWFIDVKQRKIRVIIQDLEEIKVENFDW